MVNGIRVSDDRGLKKDVVRSSVGAHEYDKKYLKKARGHIDRNVVKLTMKMKTIVLKLWMIKTFKRFIFKFP